MMTVNFKKDRRGAAANQTLFWVVFGVIVLGFVVLLLTGALDKGVQPKAADDMRISCVNSYCMTGHQNSSMCSPINYDDKVWDSYCGMYKPLPVSVPDPCPACEGGVCPVGNDSGLSNPLSNTSDNTVASGAASSGANNNSSGQLFRSNQAGDPDLYYPGFYTAPSSSSGTPSNQAGSYNPSFR